MAVTQSSVHANLNRDKILSDTWWLYYCCCGGAGLGPVGDPLVGSDVKELCLRSMCSTTTPGGDLGLIHQMSVMCCITEQCQIPPMSGTAKCMCCNKKCAGGDGKPSFKSDLFDYGQLFDETFWLYYMFCGGLGFSKPGAGRPYLAAQEKFIFVQGTVALVPPVEDGVFCSGVATELCFWSQCQLPPAPNAPKIKLCSKIKPGSGGNGVEEKTAKPTQVEMA